MFNKVVCREHIIDIIHIKGFRLTCMDGHGQIYNTQNEKENLTCDTISAVYTNSNAYVTTKHGFEDYFRHISEANAWINKALKIQSANRAIHIWNVLKVNSVYANEPTFKRLDLQIELLHDMCQHYRDDNYAWMIRNGRLILTTVDSNHNPLNHPDPDPFVNPFPPDEIPDVGNPRVVMLTRLKQLITN